MYTDACIYLQLPKGYENKLIPDPLMTINCKGIINTTLCGKVIAVNLPEHDIIKISKRFQNKRKAAQINQLKTNTIYSLLTHCE